MGAAYSYAAFLRVALVLCCSFVSIQCYDTSLLRGVKICSARDPFLNQCVQESANKVLRTLSPGAPILGLDPLDPMYIAEYTLPPGNRLIPTWSFRSTNNIQRGWRNATVQHASVDPLNRIFNFRFFIPRLNIQSRIETSGSLAGIALEGDGKYEMNFFNLTFDMKFSGDLEERYGRFFMVINNFYQNTKLDGIQWNFGNLSNDPIITERTNNILNSNLEIISSALGPVPNILLSQANQQVVQRILDNIPYDLMFIDLPFELLF